MALKDWGSLKGPLLIFLVTLFFYFLSWRIEEIPGQLGPAFWPRVILIFLMISCGIKALEVLFSRSRDSGPGGGDHLPAVNYPILAVLIALVIGVVAAMPMIGFLLSNLLFLILFMRVAGLRKKLPLFLTSALGTLFLLYLFVKVVYLPLPKGGWFFDDLTIWIYRVLHLI
jgi:putative tricarboxylic transport membrane protein